MVTWKRRLNKYGISDRIILLLLLIAIVSVVAEIISIGVFLPLFELINQHGPEGLENSNSDIVRYISYFVHSIGLDLTVEVLLLLSFVLFLLSKIMLYIATYVQAYYRGLIIKNMKNKLLNRYLIADSSYYDIVGIGDFTNSSSVELPSAVGGVMLPIKLIITAVSSVGSIILLLVMSFQLTLLSLCIIGIGILSPVRWVKATTHAGKKNSRYSSVVTSYLLDRLQSPRLIRLSNTANIEEGEYSRLTEKHRKLTLTIQLLKARIALILEPIIIGISLLMFYVALVFLEMTISTILLYMIVMVRMVPIISNILTQKQGINRSIGSIQAIDRLLISMGNNTSNLNSTDKINKIDVLRLDNVDFCYNSSTKKALSNITHTFKKSTLSAIIGPSGSGKTTFVDIISGYRKPTSGHLFVNKNNANKYSGEELMSLISYVPQSPKIFDGITIHGHISYGMPHSTKQDVINASKLSGAYDFIKNLPKGFDTILSGNSSGLSGGEKQRLDLSRALLRNTPVLIMDEPTGNLDLISERNLMLSINKIREETGKIIIIIAHRVYTIMDADQIIILEGGKISGVGTHSELLSRNSWYKEAIKNHESL